MKFIIIALFFCQTAYSQVNLFFPAEKNNIQILAQRFEYELIDKDRFRVGDVIMDASTIDMKIKQQKENSLVNLTFNWPGGLVMEGQILLRDNIGKTLLSFDIDKGKVKKQLVSTEDGYRNEIASYEIQNIDLQKVNQLKNYPFFKFCIRREDKETKVYVCSKDLYFKTQDKNLIISSRDSLRKESFVEINGKMVGSAGIIFLNEKSDVISLRSLLLSGAILDIVTFRKDVEFKDIILSEDNKFLILSASGAEPTDESKVVKRTETEWETKLAFERPITYLKGGAGIPLKQEFLKKGPIRKEYVKVLTTQTPPLKTYSKQISIGLKKNKKFELSAADADTELNNVNGELVWSLNNLKTNEVNKRYLRVTDGKAKYFAAYYLTRAAPIDINYRLSLPLATDLQLTYWFDYLSLGASLRYEKALSKKETEPESQLLGLDLIIKTPADTNYSSTNYGLIGSFDNLSLDTTKYNLIALGVFYKYKNTVELPAWFDWVNAELKVPVSLSGPGDMKLNSSYQAKAETLHFFNSQFYSSVGFKLNSFSIKNDSTKYSTNKSYFLIGLGHLF